MAGTGGDATKWTRKQLCVDQLLAVVTTNVTHEEVALAYESTVRPSIGFAGSPHHLPIHPYFIDLFIHMYPNS